MINPGTVNINGTNYKYKFNHKARRLFMELSEIEYFADYIELVKQIEPHPVKGIGIKGLQVMANIIITAIQAEQDFDEFDSDSFLDYLMENQNSMQKLMGEFSKSQEQDKKKKPQRSGGKSKAGQQ
tara:strand:- start:8044 stop:8421 length:378 start_codon:yes stop_codon:yes gene_type:complete